MMGIQSASRTLFLIDFGLARRFMSENGELLPIRKDCVKFRGTFRYAAGETHRYIE